MGGADVASARAQAEADSRALAAAKATARNRQLAIEGNSLEGMGYITGAQARAGQLDTASLNALADVANVSSSAYASAKQTASERANIALSQRSELTSLISQNPGAGVTYNDTIETAAAKINAYSKKQKKKDEEKAKKASDDAYKKQLKATAIEFGIKTKGKSMNEIEKALTKYYKEENLSKKEIARIDKALKQKELNKPYSEPNNGNTKATTREGYDYTSKQLDAVKGEDGFVSPNDYRAAKTNWINNELPVSEFESLFGHLKNPYDTY
jgi:hypothetical protein